MSRVELEEVMAELSRIAEENKQRVTITFDNAQEAKLALNAYHYKRAMEDVWERMLRPNNKHGYGDELLDKDESYEIIEKLIKIYQEINRELLDDLAEDVH